MNTPPNEPPEEVELETIISDLRSSIEWCIDPQRLSGVFVDRDKAAKAESKAVQALLRWREAYAEKARIDELERIKSIDNPDTIPDEFEALVAIETYLKDRLARLNQSKGE